MKTIAVALAALLLATSAHADGFIHAHDRQIVDGAGKPITLRGMGLGGWMLQEGYMLNAGGLPQNKVRSNIAELIGSEKTEIFYQAWRDNFITKADVDAMAAAGFNSIRLPMHYNLFLEDGPTLQWKPEGFAMIDRLVTWAKANDMTVILDLHAAPGGQGNDIPISDRISGRPALWQDTANENKMVALWAELARRYRDEPAIAAYDLLNEPNWGFQAANDQHGCGETSNAPLKALYERTIKAVRAVDPNHLIVIEGNCWGNNYQGVLPVADTNLALSFHKYWNYTTPETIQGYLNLRDQYNVPLWLGESGENSNDWMARAVELVEDHGIGWAWWPWKKFGFNNPVQVDANPGMAKITDYWAGKGPKPTAAEAETALMRLATHDVLYANTLKHPDVTDALFRAAYSDDTVPYARHLITTEGGSIPAAEYDMGRNGAAYSDTVTGNYFVSTGGTHTAGNDGAVFRNDGVDLALDAGQPVVSGIAPGEWLKYTLEADTGGDYALALEPAGDFTLTVNGAPATGRIHLLPGRNTVIVTAGAGAKSLARLVFSPAATPASAR